VLSSSGIHVSAKQNVPSPRTLFDLQLGKTDLIELAPDLVRHATQEKMRIWEPSPVALLAPREALSSPLGCGTTAGLLLQKQAKPAAALLPQWLSGYASLFTVDTNLDRAKQMRAEWVANFADGAASLRLTQLPQASPPGAAGVHP
jgi:hypothetical protein